jgi:hypothetical protein
VLDRYKGWGSPGKSLRLEGLSYGVAGAIGAFGLFAMLGGAVAHFVAKLGWKANLSSHLRM